MRFRMSSPLIVLAVAITFAACGGRQPPPVLPPPPPDDGTSSSVLEPPPPPPERVGDDALAVPLEPLESGDISGRSIDDLNRDSPLQPVFFGFDSFDLDEAGRQAASANAEVLKRYPTWMITIEGHCDERGTTEYNLALGDRRALAVKTYLVSLGIAPDRIATVSYGKEFPFDPGKNEMAWAQNRRAHFVLTAK